MLQNWALESVERPQPFLLGPVQTLFLHEIGLNALKTKFQNYIALKYCLLRELGSPPPWLTQKPKRLTLEVLRVMMPFAQTVLQKNTPPGKNQTKGAVISEKNKNKIMFVVRKAKEK
jgi:hypothetical protein